MPYGLIIIALEREERNGGALPAFNGWMEEQGKNETSFFEW